MQTSRKMYRGELPAAYVLEGYCIERVLGQGAFGITYRARDLNLNRSVAIKEYLPGWIAARIDGQMVNPVSDDVADEFASGLANFVNEAKTLAKFEHPNIVRVNSVFEANSTAYMVMQYEEGDTLSDILRKRGTLTEHEIMQFIFPLLSGLEAVHEAGFIHRDIKPANIFIRTDGTPILLDFGSARQALESHTRELTNLVTKGYAPIEQYTGKKDSQGPWTDIYGLAATLYRAIIGRPPNDAVERGEAIANNTADTFECATERAAGRYQEPFLQAIDCGLRFSREYRPQSVAEWRTELTTAQTTGVSIDLSTGNFPENFADSDLICDTLDLSETTRIVNHGVLPRHMILQRMRQWASRRNVGFATALVVVAVVAVALGGNKSEYAPIALTPTKVIELPVSNVEITQSADLLVDPATVPANEARIDELLALAADDVAALRLTTPYTANAHDKYRSVLLLDPDNEAAIGGINTIVDRYIKLSYRSIGDGKFDQAEIYIQKAMDISASGPAAVKARQTLLAKRSAAVGESSNELSTDKSKSVAELHGFRGNTFLRRIGSGPSY